MDDLPADDDAPQDAPYAPSTGAVHAFAGVALLVIGSALLRNVQEDPAIFGAGATIFLGSGFYLTIAGAVARGIQLARR